MEETTHTTPAPVDVQTLLYRFRQQGATAAAMEVSSHGLDQSRVNGVPFCSAIFTNLTRDHLDYHGTMEAYGAIKSRLFYWHGLQHAIINVDDEYGAELTGRLKKRLSRFSCLWLWFQRTRRYPHYRFHRFFRRHGSRIPNSVGRRKMPYPSARTIQRAKPCRLRCLAVCQRYPLNNVLEVLAKIRPASGRMDCIMNSGKPLVVVDYAHTPDALEKALSTLQEIKPQGAALWCVFGCGGNRDRGKRPLMGAAAVQGADKVVVTSDNPRLENPQDIINDILPTVLILERVEVDRAVAIRYAVERAAANDIILIAGKGHENYQDVQGVKHHFSDFEIAEKDIGRARLSHNSANIQTARNLKAV